MFLKVTWWTGKERSPSPEGCCRTRVYIRENEASLGRSLIILEGKYPQDEEILSLQAMMYELTGREAEAIARYEEC